MLELDSSSSTTDYQDTESTHNPIAIKSLSSLICGQEYTTQADLRTVYHAISGEAVYQVGSQGIFHPCCFITQFATHQTRIGI